MYLQRENNLNPYTSNNSPNPDGRVNTSILFRYNNAFVDRQSPPIFRNFLKVNSKSIKKFFNSQYKTLRNKKKKKGSGNIFTNLISTISPVLMSGTGLSFSDASIALLFNIYTNNSLTSIILPISNNHLP